MLFLFDICGQVLVVFHGGGRFWCQNFAVLSFDAINEQVFVVTVYALLPSGQSIDCCRASIVNFIFKHADHNLGIFSAYIAVS